MVSELMNTENKQWKSFEEQLQLLKSRGLLVDDEQAALDYLERIGYYRLSGYWYSFRRFEESENGPKKRADSFFEGSHFEDAVKLYVFDKKLRLLVLDAIERIELAIRVDVAHLLGRFDERAHENSELFDGNFSKKKRGREQKTQHEFWLEKYNKALKQNRELAFVKHYQNKYGYLPVWVAIEIWDFGMLSKIYEGLLFRHRQEIANKYSVGDVKLFVQWVKSLNYIRNVCAHHTRLWNLNVVENAKVALGFEWQPADTKRTFYYLCVIQHLMKIICPNSQWKNRVRQLIDEFPEPRNRSAKGSDIGLVRGWEDWQVWC